MDHSFSSSASPPSPNVFVVPSQTTLDLVEGKKSNRKSKKLANAAASNDFIKRNFLLSGGGRAIDRAYEDHALQLNKAAMKDLRNANVALASELAKSQNMAGEECRHLRIECNRLQIELKAETEKHRQALDKLEDELSAREEFANEYQSRVKELQKKLRDEHMLRTSAESENRTLRDDLMAKTQKAESLETLKEAEAKKAARQIERQKESIRSLEEMLAREQKLLREVTERSSDLAERLEALKEKAAEEKRSFEREASKLAESAARLESRLKNSQTEVEVLTMKNTSMAEDLAATRAEAKDFKAQINTLEAKLGIVTAELKSSKKSLEHAHEEMGRMDSRLREQESLAKYNAEKASSAEVKLAETETELNSMLRNLEMRVEENAELGANMEAVQHRWRQLKEDLANRETELDQARHETETVTRTLMAEMKGKVAALNSEIEEKESALREANSSLKLATFTAETHEEACSKVRADLEVCRRELATERSAAEEKVLLLLKDRESLQRQVDDLERTVRDKDNALSALKRSTTEDMQALQTETGALSREAARWREHHAYVKQQLEKKEQQLEALEDASRATATNADSKTKQMAETITVLNHRLSSLQGELMSEQENAGQSKREYDAKLGQANVQLTHLREHLREAEEAAKRYKMEAARAEQEAILSRDSQSHSSEELQRLRGQNTAAQERIKALREDLVAANSAHMKEMEEKSRVVNDLLSAMQAEEKAKIAAVEEGRLNRHRIAELETQLGMLKYNLNDSVDSKKRTEDAFSAAQSALHSMKKKASVYRKENKMLLSNYDMWLKTLVETRTPSPGRRSVSPGRSSPSAGYKYSPAKDTAYLGGDESSRQSQDMSDIQSYSEKLDRMFEARKSYGRAAS